MRFRVGGTVQLNYTGSSQTRLRTRATPFPGREHSLKSGSAWICFANGGNAVTFNMAAGGLVNIAGGSMTTS